MAKKYMPLNMLMTPEQLQALKEAARTQGMCVADYVRALLRERVPGFAEAAPVQPIGNPEMRRRGRRAEARTAQP